MIPAIAELGAGDAGLRLGVDPGSLARGAYTGRWIIRMNRLVFPFAVMLWMAGWVSLQTFAADGSPGLFKRPGWGLLLRRRYRG